MFPKELPLYVSRESGTAYADLAGVIPYRQGEALHNKLFQFALIF